MLPLSKKRSGYSISGTASCDIHYMCRRFNFVAGIDILSYVSLIPASDCGVGWFSVELLRQL